MPKNLPESLAAAVPLTLLLLHVILMVPSLQPKLLTLPLDSLLQFKTIGSEAAENRPRWLSSKDPLSSDAIRPVLLRPFARICSSFDLSSSNVSCAEIVAVPNCLLQS
jgi:hypothetical protein